MASLGRRPEGGRGVSYQVTGVQVSVGHTAAHARYAVYVWPLASSPEADKAAERCILTPQGDSEIAFILTSETVYLPHLFTAFHTRKLKF